MVKSLNIGDQIEVEIGPIAHGGHFISRHNGQVIFVRHGITGEKAIVKITSVSSKLAHGDAIEILEKSAKRTITTICQLHPELKYYLDDIVQFDFSTFFEYIEEKKFSDPMIHDYLLPFEKWIEQNQNSTSLKVS